MRILMIFICILIVFPCTAFATEKSSSSLRLTEEELQWLESFRERTFVVGLTGHSGYEYFEYDGEQKGYMESLVKRISDDLGIRLELKVSNSWDEVYSGLQTGAIDILYGANETPERIKFMSFTKPVIKVPYALITRKAGAVRTIGDIDNKTVGFLQNDFVIDELPKLYKNLKYDVRRFKSQDNGIDALDKGVIDAFITPGGPILYNYILWYPELANSFKISGITSDMTMSTRKSDETLVDILNKEITYLEGHGLTEMMEEAEVYYNLKIMQLNEGEKKWLESDARVVVGVTKDYLPFDYYENGDFKGIDGKILKEIAKMTGMKLEYYYSDFDDLAAKLKTGEIDILNIAKTEERVRHIIYPEPFIKERDIIVGRKDQKEVRDIFGLEGKTVAVIKGFWHYELLTKNLTNVEIKETDSIQESMELVHKGEADFLIENPTVVKYYIDELEYYDLVQRGSTNNDSFLYFGVSKKKPQVASLIDKVLPIIDVGELTRKGYEEVPHRQNIKSSERLMIIVAGLIILLTGIIFYLIKLINDLVKEKTEKEMFKQREYLLSIDALTELYNRNYMHSKVLRNLDNMTFPQAVIAADMNGLKAVNDFFGHQAGDMLLRLFADVLREACPENSDIFRIGGDEFLVILTGTSENEVKEIIERIRKTAEIRNMTLQDGTTVTSSAALGYSIRHTKETSFDDLTKIADTNMYINKREGKSKSTS
jgi:diguanylate cyclase (GGDEF)-like protein